MDNNAIRAAIVAEARSWLGTPYHHRANLKGTGCDCATFPLRVYQAVGLIGPLDIPAYPIDWNLHRSEERYLSLVESVGKPLTDPVFHPPLPGDFVLWRWGRCFAHGAIVLAWPSIIHAVRNQGVMVDDAASSARLADPQRERRFYSIIGG